VSFRSSEPWGGFAEEEESPGSLKRYLPTEEGGRTQVKPRSPTQNRRTKKTPEKKISNGAGELKKGGIFFKGGNKKALP